LSFGCSLQISGNLVNADSCSTTWRTTSQGATTGAQKSGDTHMNESDNTNDKDAGIAPFERLIADAMT
jgi:hypothetical protein